MLRNLRKGKPLPPVDDLSIGAVMKMWRQAKAKIEKSSSTLKKGISYSTFVQVSIQLLNIFYEYERYLIYFMNMSELIN